MYNCLLVGCGGFVGSVLRYLVSLIPVREHTAFPVNTLVINVAGAFLIGFLAAMVAEHENFSPQVELLLKAGLCGGFTTFSTFAFETSELVANGRTAMAIVYVAASMILGVLAVALPQTLLSR